MNETVSKKALFYGETDGNEVEKLLAGASSKKYGDYYTLLLLIASTGISLPEALELSWNDVDLENRIIEIRAAAAREVKICQSVADRLRSLFAGSQGADLVFPDADGERLDPFKFAEDLREIKELAGISDSVGVNTLRLLHGWRLLDLKVHPDVICERFGQESGDYVLDQYFKVKDQETAVQVLEEAGGDGVS